MAPMTRARTSQPGNVQRYDGDLLPATRQCRTNHHRSNATSDDSQGYSFTPGVYTDAQIEGWKG